MKERPIVFSASKVLAILAGTKTQTRRTVNMDRIDFLGREGQEEEEDLSQWGWGFDGPPPGYMVLERGLNERFNHGRTSIPCPFGEVGDRLWVREPWRLYEAARHNPWPDLPCRRGPEGFVFYKAGFNRSGRFPALPPQAMPRWASRIDLEITSVRVERLHQITNDDARAEGVDPYCDETREDGTGRPDDYRTAFAEEWEESKTRRASWKDNPFVWVISFKSNIVL